MNDDLGDRMKMYEAAECSRRMMPLLPTFARVDGRAFHSFTRGMERPYDETFMEAMRRTALRLAKETNALMTYTQSDEITLAWLSRQSSSQIWFDGRRDKMVSGISALATLYFFIEISDLMPEWASKLPTFDARTWQVPTLSEGVNVFLWRELDATKNSITMAAQSLYSDKELHGKNGSEKQEMMFARGVNWNDCPAAFKRGTYIQRSTVLRRFTTDEVELLPPNHLARKNPHLMVERSEFAVLEMPPLLRVENREAVIFDGATPRAMAIA